MTRPQDPRSTPLQDDEVELARVLRALPAGEPSARVDAAILAAATDAVNAGADAPTSPPAPRRRAMKTVRWLPGWAIGTAAAAVLAVGIGMQLRPPLTPEPLPQTTLSKPARLEPEVREQLSVELMDPETRVVPPPAPPPSSPEPAGRAARAPVPPPPPPPPVPQQAAPPAAATAEAFSEEAAATAPEADRTTLDSITVTGSRVPEPETDDAVRHAYQDAPAKRAQAKAEERARVRMQAREREQARQANAGQMPPTVAAPAPADAAAAADAAEADAATTLPPVVEDKDLPPRLWLERIRDRLRQGDRAGARASLQLYLRAYPDAPVPTDLERLR